MPDTCLVAFLVNLHSQADVLVQLVKMIACITFAD